MSRCCERPSGQHDNFAHYPQLLAGAGMATGLSKFAGSRVRQRGSSPKLLVANMALTAATDGRPFREALEDRDWWGRLAESAIGAHRVNSAAGTGIEVSWWRERNGATPSRVWRRSAAPSAERVR